LSEHEYLRNLEAGERVAVSFLESRIITILKGKSKPARVRQAKLTELIIRFFSALLKVDNVTFLCDMHQINNVNKVYKKYWR